MINTTFKLYNQNGGAPKKTTKKAQSNKGSKKIQGKKGSKKIKGLTNSASTEIQKLTQQITDKESLIDTLPSTIDEYKKKHELCKPELANKLAEVALKETSEISEHNNEQERKQKALLQEHDDKIAAIQLAEQEKYNKRIKSLEDENAKTIEHKHESHINNLNTALASLKSEFDLDFQTKKKEAEPIILQNLQAEKVKIEAERNKIINGLITDAHNHYKLVPTEYTKSVLSIVCPKDSTNELCKDIKNIPNVYDKVEPAGCYLYDWYTPPLEYSIRSERMTPKICARFCNAKNPSYNYSGVNDVYCRCGTETDFMNNKKSQNEPNKCTNVCPAAPGEICGGPGNGGQYLSVYKYTK